MSDIEIREEGGGDLMPIGIVAIVLACLGGLALVTVLLYYCFCRNRRGTNSTLGGKDGCWCWGHQRRVIVVHKRSRDPPHMRMVDKPPMTLTRGQDQYPVDMSYVHTLPVYLRSQHLRPWLNTHKAHSMAGMGQVTMPKAIMGPPQRKAIMASAGDNMLSASTTSNAIPTAYLQMGASLKLTTTKGDAPTTLRNAQASVLTHSEPEPAQFNVVQTRVTADSPPSTPPRVAMTSTSSQLYPTLSPISPYYRQSNQPVSMVTASVPTGGIHEVSGSQTGYEGPSATINVLPAEGGVGMAQSYSLDPYSLVENPTGGSGTMYTHSGVNENMTQLYL